MANTLFLTIGVYGLILIIGIVSRLFKYWKWWGKFCFSLAIFLAIGYVSVLSFLFYSSGNFLTKFLLAIIIFASIFSFSFFLLEMFTVLNVMARKSWRTLPRFEENPNQPYTPMVSIHIPICNEPPEVVIATLNSIKKLDYPFFEVIVVDNNTTKEELWKPVEAHCKKLGPRFKFFHFDKLAGAKAGALNFALSQTHPHAEIIGVIDSDYQVKPNFLKDLIPYFQNQKLAIVQAPQDYRDFSPNSYLKNCFFEYRYFFSFIMPSCNEYNAASFMGTMGLIRKKMLTSIKRWSEWCITEDTELGIRIHQNKFFTIYKDESFGKGLLPFEFRDYKKQRKRWVFGNMQIIKRNLKNLFWSSKLKIHQKISYLAQLTVWFNNLLLISFLLLGLAFLNLIGIKINNLIIASAGLLLLIFLFSKCLIFLLAFRKKEKISLKESLGALFSHLSLNWPMATAWWLAFFSPEGKFFRTPKYPHPSPIINRISIVKWELFFFLISIIFAFLLLIRGQLFLAFALFAQALLIYFPTLLAVIRYSSKI
jgi:cellulose synthase/poly-beta-1,6-N-acetylglucosamine synthase-like glycosyltransferase